MISELYVVMGTVETLLLCGFNLQEIQSMSLCTVIK